MQTHGDYAARARAGLAAQPMLQNMGVRAEEIAPGYMRLSMPFNAGFTQQHGFLHAGAVTAAMDSAAGFAALTLMPEDAGVLTVELKSSLLRPAQGAVFGFEGRVVKPGRTLLFTEGLAWVEQDDGTRRDIARLSATMMAVIGRDGIRG
ncbi:PaaI family thioesterase [Rhodalgimonas zhirmunskyi]|uniref:PaaI family thioesterase n=1 Tax=Rhodalgimonas zhirmunskyi TaxID=2964767 RepID=A0AAJ1X4V1_9RHOB|nr:PaaI family thioesterase [Rhodoalgimonas zhirmunskyi]MDQ2092904.1 PaaI family thioesterase [Rhodoalgimonas zhirmunskyi]